MKYFNLLDSEISEDVVLQAEIESRMGCLYYDIHEIKRANNHLPRAIRLVCYTKRIARRR